MKRLSLFILMLGFGGSSMVEPVVLSQVPRDAIVWSRGADIPLPRGGYYASWYRGGLLIAGGTYWKDDKKVWTDTVSYYEPGQNRWVDWPLLPLPLAYGVAAQVRGKVYLIGGMSKETLCLDIFRLDGRRWNKIGKAPTGVIYGGAAVVGDKIYVFGGGTSNNDLTTATSQSWAFDPKTLRWERLEPFPGKPRVVLAVTSVGASIFLFGGATQSKGGPLVDLSDAYRYDTTARKWTKLREMPEAGRALGITSAKGSIYLFGGVAQRSFDTVYRYEPSEDNYYLVSHLPAPLLDVKFFFKDGLFYGATGEDKARSRFPGLYIGRLLVAVTD
jgi:N-acetylneuraminic acid mutarotase